MNKLKEKYNNLLDRFKNDKRLLYVSFCTMLVIFSLMLNISFAKYTNRIELSANITIGDLNYNMQVNNGDLEDRILRIPKNSTKIYAIGLTSLNDFDTKYELTYEVCSDQYCTNTVSMPSDLEIKKLSTTASDITGNIDENGFVSISIAGINGSSTTDYYIKLGLNAGYTHNTLALTNQINETFYNDDLTIVAYVDGKEVSSFPSTRYYTVSGECKVGGIVDDSIKIVVAWDYTDSKWDITVSKVSKANTVCNLNFEKGLLLTDAIRQDYPNISEPKTVPGVSSSSSDEALLAETEDDYGTSYYFRGAVTNNYVQFANKCWRIVRITGNGAIKLVLHNNNTDNVANPCDASNNGTNAAFYGTNWFNSNKDKNAYIGFMYGTPGSSTYAAEHANIYKSSVLNSLGSWYSSTFTSEQKEKLADVIWCNDKSWSSGDASGGSNSVGSGIYETNYRFYGRTKSPSLICPNDGNGGKLSKFTVNDKTNGNGALTYKIGLLTGDEVIFAGEDSSCYLYENASGNEWWTMTPYRYSPGTFVGARVAAVSEECGVGPSYVNISMGIRPSVALISTIKILSGNGISSDPFVID